MIMRQNNMESKHLKAHNEQKRKDSDEYGLWTALHKYQSLGLKEMLPLYL